MSIPTRVNVLKAMISLGEEVEPLSCSLEGLDRRLAGLYERLPVHNAREVSERVRCMDEIVALEKEREAVAGRILAIHQRLRELRRTFPGWPRASERSGRKRQGELSQDILSIIRASGKRGIRVCELSRRVERDRRNVTTWLTVQRRRMPELVRLSPGRYALRPRKKCLSPS